MYSDIDVESAKTAINNCKEAINYESSNDIAKNGIPTSAWDADSNQILVNALDKLVTVKYKALIDELDSSLERIKNIQNIQELESQSSYYDSQIRSVNYELEEARRMEEQYKGKNTYFSPAATENRRKIKRLELELEDLKDEKERIDNQLYDCKNS